LDVWPFPRGSAKRSVHSMSASVPEVTFTPRASGDGTWYVEVASLGIGCEDVGDFRSRAAAEAWIRDMVRSCAASGVSDFGIYSVNVRTADRDAS
jgi:hypothetical protein